VGMLGVVLGTVGVTARKVEYTLLGHSCMRCFHHDCLKALLGALSPGLADTAPRPSWEIRERGTVKGRTCARLDLVLHFVRVTLSLAWMAKKIRFYFWCRGRDLVEDDKICKI
jgi:hypothetical protein